MIEPHQMTKGHTAKAVMIILLATTFYLFEFVLQTSPAVMTDDLMRSFGLNALGVSTLAAFFFYGYAPMQLPGGLLYDRFGPRLMITIAAVVCTIGALIFSQAQTYAVAAIGRLLMGAGGAFSFVGVLIVASRWFPAKYFSLIAGLLQFLGAAAAVVGQVPLAVVVAKIGWRSTLFDVFLVGVVIVILIPLIVRDYPKGVEVPERKKIGHGELFNLRAIFKNKQTPVIALYSFFAWMPMIVFGALWGVDFLSERFAVSTTVAAEFMAVVWLGVALGSPFFGWWSEKINRRCVPLYVAGALGAIAALLVVYFNLPMWLVMVCLFLFGVGTSGQALSFALVRDNNTQETVGTAMGFNNFAVVVGGAICQPLVGYLLHLGWSGEIVRGVHYYNVQDFQHAFFLLPLSFLLCALLGRFFLKETHCRSVS
jgi:MFS family permease